MPVTRYVGQPSHHFYYSRETTIRIAKQKCLSAFTSLNATNKACILTLLADLLNHLDWYYKYGTPADCSEEVEQLANCFAWVSSCAGCYARPFALVKTTIWLVWTLPQFFKGGWFLRMLSSNSALPPDGLVVVANPVVHGHYRSLVKLVALHNLVVLRLRLFLGLGWFWEWCQFGNSLVVCVK